MLRIEESTHHRTWLPMPCGGGGQSFNYFSFQANYVIHRLQRLIKEPIFRPCSGFCPSKATFVDNVTRLYTEDPETFKMVIRVAYTDIFTLVYKNTDGWITKDEIESDENLLDVSATPYLAITLAIFRQWKMLLLQNMLTHGSDFIQTLTNHYYYKTFAHIILSCHIRII